MSQTQYFILSIFLLACQTSTPIPDPTSTFTPLPTSTTTLTPEPTFTATATPLARRVLILSIDGLRPDAISLAPMPNLMALMENSAYTLSAQTIRLSATLPSHASMLTGLCPQKHGVDWNDYLPEKGVAKGIDLFDIAQAAGLETVMFVGKEKLQQVTDSTNVDKFVWINDRDKVVMENLLADFPLDFDLLFIHFATTDDMGHVYGWLSPEQLSVIFRADEAIGELLNALDHYGLRDETLLIITADHGGHDDSHTSGFPEDMTIPWIASGAGIQPTLLTSQVYTMDTAATAAYALNLQIPNEWDGVPVYEAFGLLNEARSKSCE